VLPGPLAPPAHASARSHRRRVSRFVVAGLALIALGVAGAVLWAGALSPLGYQRFSVLSPDRTFEVERPGTYIVFEEFTSAGRPDLPSPIEVAVVGHDGRPLEVSPLIRPGERAAPHAYRLPVEGRAVAQFTVSQPGRYLMRIRVLDPAGFDAGEYRSALPHTMAVGGDITTTWLGTGWAALLLGPIPVGVGLALLVVGWRRRRGVHHPRPAGAD
jgi:hypothetical protein